MACSLSLLTALCLGTGCGRANHPVSPTTATSAGGVDTTPLEKAFENSMSFRPMMDETVKIIRAAHYADALPMLQRLAANPQLTPQQKQTVDDLIQAIRQLAAPK